MTPSHLFILLKGNLIRISSGLKVTFGFFFSLSLVCLNSSGIVRIHFSCVLARLKSAVLIIFVFRLGSKLPCLFLFLFYFLVDPVPFRFLPTPCRLFSCFVWFILIHWHLNIVARALVPDVFFF